MIVEEDRALKIREEERRSRVTRRGAFGRPKQPGGNPDGKLTDPGETDHACLTICCQSCWMVS